MCLIPDVGSHPVCKGALTRFGDLLIEKANKLVLNPEVYGNTDDGVENEKTDSSDDENSIEGGGDADQDSNFGDLVKLCLVP